MDYYMPDAGQAVIIALVMLGIILFCGGYGVVSKFLRRAPLFVSIPIGAIWYSTLTVANSLGTTSTPQRSTSRLMDSWSHIRPTSVSFREDRNIRICSWSDSMHLPPRVIRYSTVI